MLSAFGSSVAEICHVYEEWGEDTDAIVARGREQVRRDLAGEGDDVRVEVEITDRVTVRGYSPVPTSSREPRDRDAARGHRRCPRLGRTHARRDGERPRPAGVRHQHLLVPAGWAVRIDGYDNAILEREA